MSLQDRCLIVSLNISCFGGKKADKRVSKEVADTHQVSDAGTFTKKLFGKDAKKLEKINNLAANARLEAERYSLPWGRGSRLVPAEKFLEYADILNSNKAKFNEAVEELANEYDDMKERAKESRKTMYNEEDYPSDIRSRYAFNIKVEPVPVSANFDEVIGLTDEIEELKEQLESDLEDSKKEASKSLRDRLLSDVNHVLGQINSFMKGGKLYKKNIEKLVDSCKIIKGLNVFGDQKIDQWTQNIISQSPQVPDMLKLDKTLAASYHHLLEQASNDLEN